MQLEDVQEDYRLEVPEDYRFEKSPPGRCIGYRLKGKECRMDGVGCRV
jgi:hypothetical protein